ncbi:FG-GAP-like repeat-containing protein, partial [Flavitalea sp.]|nr:FG-GAP-like repeat-containing protein [Flavitalea sp.]
FSVLSDSVIIAVIAPGTDSYIRVSNNYGTSGPGPYYRYSTVPVIHSFTPILGGERTRMKIYIDRIYDIDSVKIGGVPVREWIPTYSGYLDVIIGKGATGKISLQTADTTIFSSDSFEYVQKPTLKSFTPATGKAGTVVTITGVNIHRSSKIYFGDAMASRVTVLSDSVLTAVVGSGASGEVKLETAGGRMSLPGFIFIPSSIPVLKSFFPVSGKAGTMIEIAGENFNTDPELNFVGFGAAFGKVISASPSLLKVEVPHGASAEFLTVSCNGFTATSNNFFTLQGSVGRQLSDTTYKAVNTVIKAMLFPGTNMEADDLDGDGKPDLIVTTELDKLKVYRNTSSQDSVSFEEVLTIENVSLFQNILVADVDGDGRPELVAGETSIIKIFKNTSITGKISFDAPAERIGGTYSFFSLADINGDGKPEILSLSDQGEVIIFRNTSSGSTISFGSRYIFPKGKTTSQFEVGDLDGDGKPEVISAISRSDQPVKSMLIFQNTSTTDTISFGSPLNFNGGDSPQKFILGDINRDNKTDLIINYNRGIQYVENTSGNGILSFALVTNIMTTTWTTTNDIGDLNGDGLVDLVCEDSRDSILHIYVQKQTNNVVSFVEIAQTKTNEELNDISIRDLNKNGSPEILFIGSDNYLHIFSADTILTKADTCSFEANTSIGRDSLCTGNQLLFTASGSGFFSNASYQWFVNGNPQSYTGARFKDPMLNAGDKISVVMKVNTVCGLKADTSNVITITSVWFAHHEVSITAALINQCDPFAKTFTVGQITFVNPGSNNNGQVIDPASGIYLWKVNGQPAGSNTGVLTLTNLKAGDIVWLEYLLPTPCGTDTIISNKSTVSIYDRVKPTAKITGDTQVKQGETSAMKVETTNPPGTITYQWQDSTSVHSWGSITGATLQLLMYKPSTSGDKLRNIIISKDSCNFIDTIVTNPVIFVISDSPLPLANMPIRAFPNPVGSTLSLDNINPADNWQSLELLGADGHKFIIMKDIQNRTSINLSVVHIPRGLYFVVFKRATGESAFLRILKQ